MQLKLRLLSEKITKTVRRPALKRMVERGKKKKKKNDSEIVSVCVTELVIWV